MKHSLYCLCLITLSVIIFSCSKSGDDTTGGNTGGNNTGGGTNPGTCDTVNMQYTAHVKPILQGNCYSCHGNGQSNGGVTLDTYNGVKAVADNGKLIGVITHAAGYKPMPQGGAKLSDCNINKIRSWINRGGLNN